MGERSEISEINKMSEMSEVMRERVKQLFKISDKERKGFIIKRDMQRMHGELALSPQQLEDVFDSLDVEDGGFLTLDNFLRGFGEFLANNISSDSEMSARQPGATRDQDNDQYQDLITRIADTHVLEDTQTMRQLCDDVNELGSQQLQLDLEAMLIDLLKDLRGQKKKQVEMEQKMRSRDKAHNVEVRMLFEEMETNLKEAKSKMAVQIEQRMRQVRAQLEEELTLKTEELKEVTSQKHRVSLKLHILRASEAALRRDNVKLVQQKSDLEETCERQTREMKKMKQKMAQHLGQEQNKHVAAGFRLAQRIIAEEQGLMQQLRILKTMTRTLEERRNQETENNLEMNRQEVI